MPGGLGKEFKDREVRYHYEFSLSCSAIEHELLLGYFSSRPTRLLERDVKDGISTWHKYLGHKIDVAPRELALSRGFVSGHEVLQPFVRRIISGVEIFNVGDKEREKPLAAIKRNIARGRLSLEMLSALAAVADIGVTNIKIEEPDLPETLRLALERVKYVNPKIIENALSLGGIEETKQRERDLDSYRCYHHGIEGASAGFEMKEESSGTLSWLAIAVPLVEALRDGTVLCVDELDTSLHPALAAAIIALIQDAESNPRGAQLIFTSHDISLLQPQSPAQLEKEQIWLTEKDTDGASTLFSLQDFDNLKSGSNLAKQYLEGRFGALPFLLPGLIRSVIAKMETPPSISGC